ncbi:uncharacterized protein LOC109858794 isoform X2 [Pseudomyrmex gracilis]|nr:uncharacterized protein LOC109858794 isoform X2 [Pseudomyrmex gracilis]XP_020291994.1 uncharacterized protein LOC109858794 isoform X2 [Pseudomyrmex gracilis]XP_020291995.1 uncharacterized protein LOC109858794 isoform X2 [Pseudomyrmex gracilis]XP_020291996.1 uncharacterized protein LOC109858794 isoform X2 [Pseudomyrmex gracilis]
MVVSHREPSISTNIRAIIEQLNLSPVKRRQLIDKKNRKDNARCKSFPDGIMDSQTKISIGIYGCKERNGEFEISKPICKSTMRKIERARPETEARRKFSTENKKVTFLPKKEAIRTDQIKKEASFVQTKKETQTEYASKCPIVSIGFFNKDKSGRIRSTMTATSTTMSLSTKILPKGQKMIEREHITRICDYSTIEIVRSTKDVNDRTNPVAKDLPQLESASLSHTAAHHRISVRPKNRRPPRRVTSTISNVTVPSSSSIPLTVAENTLDNLEQKVLSQQQSTSNASSTEALRTIGVTRKLSSRLSRNSDIFEELETRLPRKSSATSLSPDSLDVTTTSRSSTEMTATAAEEHQQSEVRWVSITRRPSTQISKSSDVFEELEAKLPRRRSSSNRLSKSPDSLDLSPNCWYSKSTEEDFDKLVEYEEITKPISSVRQPPFLNQISKSSDRVFKSSDSIETIEPLVSDDSIERRQSGFDFRTCKRSRPMSKSSESFDVFKQRDCIDEEISQELQKRSSVSDINLARDRKLSKNISKSFDNFDKIDMCEAKDDVEIEVIDYDVSKDDKQSMKRISSESSDNQDVENRIENRRIRRIPKRIPSAHVADAIVSGDEGEKRPTLTKKPPRLQKSSESSELGSTDTLDSERRNKSSESTETLDSLEKDLEQDRKDSEVTDSVLDKHEKNVKHIKDFWSSRNIAVTDSEASMRDDTEKSFIPADNKYYWRQSSEPVSKENLGIQQLLAITIMTTRITDNDNNQRSTVIYPKKKQQSTSQPTSPVTKQEDTKMLFDNLLVSSRNDEDLQNMLNGNISEVSTDTKSFKEKLIMFEKLGK